MWFDWLEYIRGKTMVKRLSYLGNPFFFSPLSTYSCWIVKLPSFSSMYFSAAKRSRKVATRLSTVPRFL